MPYQNYFLFNNSALFASKSGVKNKFSQIYWEMGEESFKDFFDYLGKVTTKSLKLTAEVLKERDHLQTCMAGLQPQVQKGLMQLANIQEEENILKSYEADIKANRNFSYEVKEIHSKQVKLEPAKYVTNCLFCNRTCHFPCYIPIDEEKYKCWAMKDGRCRICPNQCSWVKHKNNNFRYVNEIVYVRRTHEDLKAKYAQANSDARKRNTIIKCIQEEHRNIRKNVMDLVKQIHDINLNLQKIAIRDNPLSVLGYIDMLIDSEKDECKTGWRERVKALMEVRKDAEMLEAIKKLGPDQYDPFVTDDYSTKL